jgi:hypothetical protein
MRVICILASHRGIRVPSHVGIRLDSVVESTWNVMAHGDAREGKWKRNWPMEWVVSTFHTTSEHGASSITTADPHTSAASSRLNWHPRRCKWTRPFRRKMKSGFCACAITFQTQSTAVFSRHYLSTNAPYLYLTVTDSIWSKNSHSQSVCRKQPRVCE